MLDGSHVSVIRDMHFVDGLGIREIARRIGCSRNTVRNWIRNPHKEAKVIRPLSDNGQWLSENELRVRALYFECEGFCLPLQRELKDRYSRDISLRMLERFCKRYHDDYIASIQKNTRFETLPGDQMQIDFGTKRVLINGVPSEVHLFVAKLGLSRRSFAKAYFCETCACWLDGIESAMAFFGGRPNCIVSDNASPLVRNPSGKKELRFTEKYKGFCNYHCVTPKNTAIRKPRSKGKVENAVKYVKQNALPGKQFNSLDELNLWLEQWSLTVADHRKLDDFIPGIRIPTERFLFEKHKLRSLKPRIALIREENRRVNTSGLIRVDNQFYKVPDDLINKEVQILISETTITVLHPSLKTLDLDKAKQVYRPQEQPPVTEGLEAEKAALKGAVPVVPPEQNPYEYNPYGREPSSYNTAIGWGGEHADA